MNRLFVYGDFDWLETPVLIGELGYESLRGSDSYSFKFDKGWLAKYGNIFLSADINNFPKSTRADSCSRRETSCKALVFI